MTCDTLDKSATCKIKSQNRSEDSFEKTENKQKEGIQTAHHRKIKYINKWSENNSFCSISCTFFIPEYVFNLKELKSA